jgi:ketosteroid isomerase-like protein
VKRFSLCAVLLLMLISTCFAADAKKGAVPDKAFMQQILDAWNTMDPSKPAPYYSKNPENVYFDIAPLKYNGWSEYQKGVQQVLAAYSSIKLTVNDDARVHPAGKVTWATATLHLDGTHKDGSKDNTDGRWTVIWEKQGGEWLIVHEQVSLPAGPPAATAQGGGGQKNQRFLPRDPNWM